ncbi:MAG: hypothetical protein H0U29_02155 [Acidimicrobiia bacterium]|nr:hypothetical protein [Acidimicrobiia bacterium]
MSRRRAWLAATALLLVPACTADGGGSEGGGGNGGGGGAPTTTEPTTETTGGGTTTTTTEEPSEDPDQAVVDAVDATLATESFTVSSEANLQIAGQDLQLTAEGSIDYAELVADATIGIDADGEAYEIGIRSDGTMLWVRAEGDGAPFAIPEGKAWVEGESSRLEQSDGFAQIDLIGVVVALRAADGTEAGDTDEIDGVSAQKYTTSVDYDEAVEAAGPDAAKFQSALSVESEDPVALDIEVWVGDDGVIRRFQLDIDAGQAPLGGDYRIELTDVGSDVEVPEAPPSEDVLSGAAAEDLLDQVFAT